MRTRCLVVILLCCLPAFADKNRREAEKVVVGIEDSLKRVGGVQQSSGGRREDTNCNVGWTESVLVTDKLGCKVAFEQTGSNVQTCVKDGATDKSIVSNEWDNKINFDLSTLDPSTVGLKERKNETLNDFPTTAAGKMYELSFRARRQERVISWSSKLKYTSYISRGSKGPENTDVKTDHQEGVWDRFAFMVSDQTEGQRLVQAFSQAMALCSAKKK
jgi:hypothetical protein